MVTLGNLGMGSYNELEKISCPRCDYRIPVSPELIDYKSAYKDCKDMCERFNEENEALFETCRSYKAENRRM